MAFRLNHNMFRDIEGRQLNEFDLTRGTLSNQTPTSGRFSQGRATREYRDYEQEHLINAYAIEGNHLLSGSTYDWRAGSAAGSGIRRDATTGSSAPPPTHSRTPTT